MRTKHMVMAGFSLMLVLSGCDPTTADGSADDADYIDDPKADGVNAGLSMPKSIITWENQQGWGNHHIMWHMERRWDLLNSSNKQWAQKQGWSRADLQEGTAGNGIEFLAMHRVMIQMLEKQFPKSKALFAGWETPPVDPRDKQNPLPNGGTDPFDDNMLDAISKLETDLASFTSDDDFGLYIETALRPTAKNASAKSKDVSTGIHNYVHNRFSDPSSPIDIGDPTVNLGNRMFWRLHGWIDARWTAVRKAKGFSDSDPTYKKALANATMEMSMNHCCPTAGATVGATAPEPIPADVRHFMENDGN